MTSWNKVPSHVHLHQDYIPKMACQGNSNIPMLRPQWKNCVIGVTQPPVFCKSIPIILASTCTLTFNHVCACVFNWVLSFREWEFKWRMAKFVSLQSVLCVIFCAAYCVSWSVMAYMTIQLQLLLHTCTYAYKNKTEKINKKLPTRLPIFSRDVTQISRFLLCGLIY